MEMGAPGSGSIRLRHAIALYTSSVLGSGILVLPGLTAQIAGPASIIAWLLLSLASFPFAITFASISARRKSSVGIYSFGKEAFGLPVATISAWLFFLWTVTGAPAVALVAATYLSYAVFLNKIGVFVVAFCVILTAFVVNYRGIVFSNRVQIAVIGSIVALLLVTIAVSVFFVKPANFTPFLPHGTISIGMAAALIFWSFLGYENVSNVAGEFQNPEKDFKKSVIFSVVLIGALYIAISLVTIGTRAYLSGGSIAPFAAILSNILGRYAGFATGIVAVFIIFGLINAYTTGMSRVFQTSARDGGLPKGISHSNSKSGSPDRALLLMISCMIPVFAIYYAFNVNLETAFLVSGGAAIFTYIIAFASTIKIVRADRTIISIWMPVVSLGISIVILVFVGLPLIASIIVIAGALLYSKFNKREPLPKSSAANP